MVQKKGCRKITWLSLSKYSIIYVEINYISLLSNFLFISKLAVNFKPKKEGNKSFFRKFCVAILKYPVLVILR